MVGVEDLEVIEVLETPDGRRFRIKVKGTIIVLNVTASDENEAKNKAISMIREMELEKVLDLYKRDAS